MAKHMRVSLCLLNLRHDIGVTIVNVMRWPLLCSIWRTRGWNSFAPSIATSTPSRQRLKALGLSLVIVEHDTICRTAEAPFRTSAGVSEGMIPVAADSFDFYARKVGPHGYSHRRSRTRTPVPSACSPYTQSIRALESSLRSSRV